MRGKLVATFNSAFKLADSGGGVVIGGHTYAPMKADMATIVRYRDGRVDLIAWNGGAVAGPNVVYARQNLPLIVDNGRPNSNLSDRARVGCDARQRDPGLALRRRDRPLRQPDLRRRQHPDRRLAGRDPQARRRRPRDGARHQHLLAELHHLSPSGRDRRGEPAGEHGPLAAALPDAGRPRLLRRLPSLRSHRPGV